MRRILTLVTLAALLLGPLAALLPASADAPLPACCRRAGMHHCAMSADAASVGGNAKHFSTPSRCSRYPVRTSAVTPVYVQTEAGVPRAGFEVRFTCRERGFSLARVVSSRSGRSPPSLA